MARLAPSLAPSRRPCALLSVLLASTALLLAACSGGSGAPAGRNDDPPPDVRLLLDTGAGTTATLEGTLAVVALETVDGQSTQNLLARPTAVPLAEPLPETRSVALRGVAPANYRALTVMFETGSVVLRDEKGSRRIEVPGPVRVPLEQPLEHRGSSWLQLRHRGALDVKESGGRLVWSPDWTVVREDPVWVRSREAEVRSIDRDAARVRANLEDLDDLPVTLAFGPDSVLTAEDEDDRLDVARFLTLLEPGDELVVAGLLDAAGLLTVVTAHLEGEDDDRRGRKSEVHGVIRSLRAADESFLLRVERIRKERTDLPPVPFDLRVAADDARIKWVPRRGRHKGHLDFDALETGMRVEVEFFGAVGDAGIEAFKIDIRAKGQPPVDRLLEGQVTRVRTTDEGVELTLANVDKRRLPPELHDVAEFLVRIGSDATVLQEGEGGRLTPLPPTALGTGDSIMVLGEAADRTTVQARLVVRRAR